MPEIEWKESQRKAETYYGYFNKVIVYEINRKGSMWELRSRWKRGAGRPWRRVFEDRAALMRYAEIKLRTQVADDKNNNA